MSHTSVSRTYFDTFLSSVVFWSTIFLSTAFLLIRSNSDELIELTAESLSGKSDSKLTPLVLLGKILGFWGKFSGKLLSKEEAEQMPEVVVELAVMDDVFR